MKILAIWAFVTLSTTTSVYAQRTTVLGLVCRSGKAQYHDASGWKSFSAVKLPLNSRVRLQPQTILEVYEQIPLKNASGFFEDGRTYTYKAQNRKESIVTEQSLRLGLQKATRPVKKKPNFLQDIIGQLFSGKEVADNQMGDQGGSPRGQVCPLVKLASVQMESLFASDSVHLLWSSVNDTIKTYSVSFYESNTTRDHLIESISVVDTSLHLKAIANRFQPGEVYYWSVKTIASPACERNAFRLLKAAEKTQIDSTWNRFTTENHYSTPLIEVFQAEYYAVNGLYYLANKMYSQLGKDVDLTPEIVSLRRRFYQRMGLNGK